MTSEAEMTALVHEVAGYAAPSTNWKERVHAAARALRLPFGRVKTHYYGEARRVDAGEMDRARAVAEELREAALRRKAAEHVAWLSATVEHLRQTDAEFHSVDLDGLERAIARAGASYGALGNPGPEDHDQSREWGGHEGREG
jgi:hypothetical protein